MSEQRTPVAPTRDPLIGIEDISTDTTTDGTVPYSADVLSRPRTLLAILIAGLGGGLATLLCWILLKHTHLPAFGSSMVSRAVATALVVLILVVLLTVCYLWMNDEHARREGVAKPRGKIRVALTYLACYLSPAGIVVATLAVPLSATRLYLDGISVDQAFRTQLLTRLTDSPQLSDMNYAQLAPFYPSGWFWVGGRFSALLHLDGWEGFQPWSLVSLAAAASLLVPVWQRLCGSLVVATGIALVTTCIVLVMSSVEPYAAIIALGAPAVTVLTRHALEGARLALIGVALYIGLSASMYTLYTAVIALSVVILSAIIASGTSRTWKPLGRMILIGIVSAIIASPTWAPYILAVLRGMPRSESAASHYLPLSGTELPLPMFSLSLVGVLCFLGVIYLVARAVDPDVRALGIALVVFYGWTVASMVASLAGTTLLGFRMETLITVQLATAGVCALADIRMVGVGKLYPQTLNRPIAQSITAICVILLGASGIYYAQSIPTRTAEAIDLAYTDTDGSGTRADTEPADSGTYYSTITSIIAEHYPVARDTVVLTDEANFLAYYPYRGFQALTAHYANPLGQFEQRNELITTWAETSWEQTTTPSSFTSLIDDSPWPAPDVFIFRGTIPTQASDDDDAATPDDASITWKYDLSEDIYPNNPNVRFKAVLFSPAAFGFPSVAETTETTESPDSTTTTATSTLTDPATGLETVVGAYGSWEATQVGPFVVVVRASSGESL